MSKTEKSLERYNKYFEVRSRLGILVGTTKGYWNVITDIKHPTIRGREAEVKGVLSNPDEIRISKRDKTVLLFYKKMGRRYLCVVTKFFKKRGFIITAYWTKKIKEGELKWKR